MKYILFALVACICVALQSCTRENLAANSAGEGLIITTADLPSGIIGQPYTALLSVRGGNPPYDWRISNGRLPPGLTVTSSTGAISGTPAAVGWSDLFTVHVQDSSGNFGLASYSIIISPPLDQYGGSTGLPCKATGWFHAEKIGDRWLFCDPLGHASFRVSAAGILLPDDGCDSKTGQCNDYRAISKRKYGDLDAHWGPQQVRRIQSWGFNTVGQLSTGYTQPFSICRECDGWPNGEQPVKVPTFEELLVSNYAAYNLDRHADHATKDLAHGLNNNYSGWRASLLDFFDDAFEQWIDVYFSQPSMQTSINSRWIMGISLDDSDYLWGMGAGPDLPSRPPGHTNSDLAYMVLITSPTQTFNPNIVRRNIPQLYVDTKVYSKVGIPSAPATCSIATPCSLRDYLYEKYNGDINALNAAWGTKGYYTTFDSSGTQVKREIVGTGDGRTTSFTHTLAKTPVSPESVVVSLGDTAQAGDCPWWIEDCKIERVNTGSIGGTASTAIVPGNHSTIDYSNGQLTISLKNPLPAGQQITIDYVWKGWTYGTGLMDEDGRHTAWLGNNPVCLAPAAACDGKNEPLPNAVRSVAADLDGWISQFSAQYFKSCRTGLKKHAPHVMYFGSDSLGTWGVPPRKEVLEGAAPYIDGIVPANLPEQAPTDYMAQYSGDKPMFASLFCAATRDSALFRYPGASAGVYDFATQQQRGQTWHKWIGDLIYLKAKPTGSYPYLGASWWGLVDFWNEKTNWGLVSLNDNAYDGKSAVRLDRKDQWGYATGGEMKDYGDALDYVKQGNSLWYSLMKTAANSAPPIR